MNRTLRIKITELNPHLICALCGGYYIDASTIRECLHSFCRTCITKYLETTKYCPICDVMVHKTKPLLYVKSDKNLQDLVYKLVPGLYKDEMKRRREFYAAHPEEGSPQGPSEARGFEDKDRLIYTEDEKISLALELFSDYVPEEAEKGDADNPDRLQKRDIRYLQCPAAVSVSHLKKFLRLKFDLPDKYKIDIFHSDEPLKDFFTLMDISYIYTWRRTAPLRLLYTVYEPAPKKRKAPENEPSPTKHEKQPKLDTDEVEIPKENKCVEKTNSNKDTQISKETVHIKTEQVTMETERECDIDTKQVFKSENEERISTSPKYLLNNNSKLSPPKTKVDKESVKNVLSGKKSSVKTYHQGGKFFSSSFYSRKAIQREHQNDRPIDMTQKTLKKNKDVAMKRMKENNSQNSVNGNHYPGYEFTD